MYYNYALPKKAFCIILFSISSILLIFSVSAELISSINAALLTVTHNHGLISTNTSFVVISITRSQSNNNPFLNGNRNNGLKGTFLFDFCNCNIFCSIFVIYSDVSNDTPFSFWILDAYI